MKIFSLIVAAGLLFGAVGYCQDGDTPAAGDDVDGGGEKGGSDAQGTRGFWEAKVGGGDFVVALSRISSVSRHKYVLDGALIVDEVTVDTTGQAMARFYFITPITSGIPGSAASLAAEKALGMVDKAVSTTGSDMQNMVVKTYPGTTHAKTIEYRLLTQQQLDTLFESAKSAWQSGKGRIYSAE